MIMMPSSEEDVMIRVCCFLLFLFGLVVVANAQTVTGSLSVTGNVLDQNDAVLAGAQVVLRDGQRKEIGLTKTDAAGAFRLDKISTGDYEIEITHKGFKPEVV